ncbi:MAG: MaoC/PaaZ C-terminal domain-containing protein [Pseudomonadota bacterium]
MALRLDLVGKKFDSFSDSYTEDDAILYALSIGAGVGEELDFLYEKDLKVFPTFAVIPYSVHGWDFPVKLGMDMFHVLHGEQKIEWHGLLPPQGTLHTESTLEAIYDKGEAGAVAHVVSETRDKGGQLLFVSRAVIFDRSAGNFGGDRGPRTEKVLPPEGREPDFRVEEATSPDQAALYRLNGDKNPLHIEPEFAQRGGFPKPILHGLCTYGYAGRAILSQACGRDPARLKSLSVRFAGVVFPGETLITEGWQTQTGTFVFQTRTGDGRVVLSNGQAETA